MKKDYLIENLRKIMKEKNLSTIGAARFLDTSPKQVSRWLNYENKPTMIFRKAIARGIKRLERLP